MFPIESFKNSLLKIVAILQELEIPFHLTGGITGVVYGEPRLTQDIDVVVENQAISENLDSLMDKLRISDFVFSPDVLLQAVGEQEMFQLFDSVESLKLDIYPREMIEGELSRSQSVELFDSILLPIASRVDAAISKLIWASKGSHKSRRDFRQIAMQTNDSDMVKIREMASDFQLSAFMNDVLSESDEISS